MSHKSGRAGQGDAPPPGVPSSTTDGNAGGWQRSSTNRKSQQTQQQQQQQQIQIQQINQNQQTQQLQQGFLGVSRTLNVQNGSGSNPVAMDISMTNNDPINQQQQIQIQIQPQQTTADLNGQQITQQQAADLPALPQAREKPPQTTRRDAVVKIPPTGASCAPASLALAGLMPGRHGTPGVQPGSILDHPVFLRAGVVTYIIERVIGNGSFGVVVQSRVDSSGEVVAIKRVLQDRRYKNRELQMMKMLRHPNIVELKNSFYNTGSKPEEVFLNLVMEYLPETVYKTCRDYVRRRQSFPTILVKLYIFQLCRALAYMHSLGACHRDIKPQNLLVDVSNGILKLCDFGSAKVLQRGEANVAYICSRYYRAPELIFGATQYTTAIDIWSTACVMAELFLGQPLFPGDSGVDQLVEIIKVLGAPTHEQVLQMNKSYPTYNFPDIKPHPFSKIFRQNTPPEAIDMLQRILVYTPTKRPHAIELCAHPFFDELRDPNTRLPDGNSLPRNLFDFTQEELTAANSYGVRERLLTPVHTPLQLPHLSNAIATPISTTPNSNSNQNNSNSNANITDPNSEDTYGMAV